MLLLRIPKINKEPEGRSKNQKAKVRRRKTEVRSTSETKAEQSCKEERRETKTPRANSAFSLVSTTTRCNWRSRETRPRFFSRKIAAWSWVAERRKRSRLHEPAFA